jgi:hypothetical protein
MTNQQQEEIEIRKERERMSSFISRNKEKKNDEKQILDETCQDLN